jgi:hypothetical protein
MSTGESGRTSAGTLLGWYPRDAAPRRPRGHDAPRFASRRTARAGSCRDPMWRRGVIEQPGRPSVRQRASQRRAMRSEIQAAGAASTTDHPDSTLSTSAQALEHRRDSREPTRNAQLPALPTGPGLSWTRAGPSTGGNGISSNLNRSRESTTRLQTESCGVLLGSIS